MTRQKQILNHYDKYHSLNMTQKEFGKKKPAKANKFDNSIRTSRFERTTTDYDSRASFRHSRLEKKKNDYLPDIFKKSIY